MPESFEYCVIGAGIIGSSAAYLLAREKKSVLLLEQFDLGHDRGSSHGESRITRYAYDHPLYVRMAKRGYPLWQEIIQESGAELFTKTGGIDLDEIGGKGITDCRASLEEESVDFELLDHKELSKRYPQFSLPAGYEAIFQKDSGILNASLSVKTLLQLAIAHGAQVKGNSVVEKIETEGKQFAITFAGKKVLVKKLILSAGSWMGPLLRGWGLNLPLKVTQEQWAFFECSKPELFQPDRFPVFIQHGGTGSGGIGWYGFPTYGRAGVKSAFHQTGKPCTADTRDFEPDEKQLEFLKSQMEKLLPDASGEILYAGTCLYTNTPDTHFVIDKLPGADNASFFTGCSGHAFKFGPVIAEILIQLLEKKETVVPLTLFSKDRFSAR